MMRKAGLARRSSRRSKQEDGNSSSNTSVNSSSSNKTAAAPLAVSSEPDPVPAIEPTPQVMPNAGARRKPTLEEAALTAKNYRLAKELSELRVRHREECKNVTRLTMENMNLASRCREAISHVAMLKKELAAHQRRAAEALALQRQQTERMGNNPLQPKTERLDSIASDPGPERAPKDSSPKAHSTSPTPRRSSLSDVAAEMDRMDRILAAHASSTVAAPSTAPPPPPPPPATPPPSIAHPAETLELTPTSSLAALENEQETASQGDKIISIIHPTSGESQKDSPQKHTPQNDSSVEPSSPNDGLVSSDDFEIDDSCSDEATSMQGSPIAERLPRSDDLLTAAKETKENDEDTENFGEKPFFPHSASPKFRGSYNEEYPGDITSVRKSAARHKIETLGDFREADDENSVNSSISRVPPFDTLLMGDQNTMSSIDAFEASFNISFPESFSPKDSVDEKKSHVSSEIYNPFFSSPSKPKRAEKDPNAESPAWGRSVRDRSTAPVQRMGNNTRRSNAADPPGKDRTSPSPSQSKKSSSSLSSTSPSTLAEKKDSSQTVTKSPNGVNVLAGSVFSSSPNATSHRFSPGTPPAFVSQRNTRQSPVEDDRYRTPPPPFGRSSPTSPGSEQPARPEKKGYDAARSRYEKALFPQRRKSEKDHPLDEQLNGSNQANLPNGRKQHSGLRDRVTKSPRKQDKEKSRRGWSLKSTERKDSLPLSDEDEDGDIPLRSSLSKGNSEVRRSLEQAPNCYGVEKNVLRKRVQSWECHGESLDVDSDEMNRPTRSGKNRRNVKQPIAYAEPSGSSKLRRGDMYSGREEITATGSPE